MRLFSELIIVVQVLETDTNGLIKKEMFACQYCLPVLLFMIRKSQSAEDKFY